MVFKKMQIFDKKLIHTSFCFPRNVRVKPIVVNYINKTTVEQISMYYYGEGVNIMIYCYICKKKVNVVTCDYKSQCSHM